MRRERDGRFVFERIGFVNSETRRPHACDDVVGNLVAADVAEGTGQASRHSAVGAGEQATQDLRSISDEGKGCAHSDGTRCKLARSAGDEGG